MVVTTTHIVTARRSLQRYVNCEKCGCEFTFVAGAKGFGQNSNLQDAQVTAVTDAHNKIGLTGAPCPDCGWYQASMFKGLRRAHHGWMRQVGLGLLGAAFTLVIVMSLGNDKGRRGTSSTSDFATAEMTIACVMGVTGLGLAGAHALLAARYRPNEDWPRLPTGRRAEPCTARTIEYQRRLDGSPPQSWYVFRQQQKSGPFRRDEIIAALQAGDVLLTDHLWTEGLDGWRPASKGLVVPS